MNAEWSIIDGDIVLGHVAPVTDHPAGARWEFRSAGNQLYGLEGHYRELQDIVAAARRFRPGVAAVAVR